MAVYNPYAAQEADIARRRHMADVLEEQSFKPIQQFNYNGIPAPISPLSGLAKVLSSYGAGKLGREAAAAETKLGADRTAARARSVDMLVKAMGGTPKGEDTPATPGTDPSLGTTFEPVDVGHDAAERPVVIPGTMGTPAVLGTPAVRGGVTDALALSLEDSEIQGIALGLAKDERGREQALKLAQMTTDRATTVAQQKADTAVLLQEMKARAASGDTTQMKNYAFLQTLSSEDQDAFTVLFNRNSRSLTSDQAMEKTRLEIQGRLDVARLNNEGALNRTQLTLDAKQLTEELRAKAANGGTAEMKNFNFFQGLSSEDKAVFAAEFNRQPTVLTFEQRAELAKMAIEGANARNAATIAGANQRAEDTNAAKLQLAELAARAKGPNALPSDIRSFLHMQSFSPGDQIKFMAYRRANPYLDVGNALIQFDALTGEPVNVVDKGVAPTQRTVAVNAQGTVTTVPGAPGIPGAGQWLQPLDINAPRAGGQPPGATRDEDPRVTAERAEARQAKLDQAQNDATLVVNDLNKVLELLDVPGRVIPITGPAAVATQFTGDARTLADALAPIKARIDLTQLRLMRDASTSGASGLGQVTQGEHKLLQDAWGRLNQFGRAEDLRENITLIKAIFSWVLDKGDFPQGLPAELRGIAEDAKAQREAARRPSSAATPAGGGAERAALQAEYDRLMRTPTRGLTREQLAAWTKRADELEQLLKPGT